jgi:thioester reductase-like protein
MSLRHAIFLTGATGLLGRYFLRDLLVSGYPVAVLIRNSSAEQVTARLDQLLAFGEDSLKRKLPRPTLIQGDLNEAKLGLTAADRSWLSRHARDVLHSAAYVAYHATPDGEPWKTNVSGTRRLIELCRSLGLNELHYLSTAFVCGDRRGVVREDELDCGRGSGNAYEKSKFAAEQLLRGFPGIQATIYRPSIVVGDSSTGYTSSYHHFYRFLELAVRLFARSVPTAPARRLTLRLPLSGEERQNIVPVDWVSRALVELVRQPDRHGRTYHLVARRGVSIREVTAIVEDLLQFKGIQWVGAEGLADPTSVEQMVLEQFQDYWSYLRSDLIFDCRNMREALPDLPSPTFNREFVARLLRFAHSDGWGRDRTHSPKARSTELAEYLEDILPAQMQRSRLAAALPPDLAFVIDILGRGRWTCRCRDRALDMRSGVDADADFTYRLEAQVFNNLIRGRETAQHAFLQGHIQIDGDMEKALKMAMLIEEFLAETTGRLPQRREELRAVGER